MATASLQWSAPADTRIQGYRVYYGTQPRSYLQAKGNGFSTNSTAYVVGNLVAGRTYYFAVTAFDASGSESDYSAEVSKLVN